MSQLKVTLYFLQLATALFASALSGSLLYFSLSEGASDAVPYIASFLLISLAWSTWRIQVQQKYRFKMSRIAFRTFCPAAFTVFGVLVLGATEWIVKENGFRGEARLMMLALFGTGVLSLGALAVNYPIMARKEKISYGKKRLANPRRRKSKPLALRREIAKA